MSAPGDFTTSSGATIPGHVMARIARRLAADDDWQLVATEELRRFIPESDDDLDEVNEVLSAVEASATPEAK